MYKEIKNQRREFLRWFFTSKPVSRVLSFKTAIYLDAPLPIRSSRLPGTVGPTCCPSTALLRIEFTAMDAFTRHWVSSYLAFPPLLINVSGISLLHFSWGRPRRVLPVILALWSPDFPHKQTFRSARAAVQLACPFMITKNKGDVKWFFFPSACIFAGF